jgi:hypothetical protein
MQAPLSRDNQDAAKVIKVMIANGIVPKSYGRYKKRPVEDASDGERIFECDALIVESAVRKIGEVPFARFA